LVRGLLQLESAAYARLEQDMKQEFELKTLQEGYDLYRDEGVISVQVLENGQIAGQVRNSRPGGKPHPVKLDLDFFSISECGCGRAGYCSHMAAVFYVISQDQGRRPELFLQQCRAAYNEQKNLLVMEELKKQDSLKRETQRLKEEAAARARKQAQLEARQAELAKLPQASGSPEDWHSYFERECGTFLKVSGMQQLEFFNKRLLGHVLNHSQGWPEAAALLYRIHALLYGYRKITQYLRNPSNQYLLYHQGYVFEFVRQLWPHFLENLRKIHSLVPQIRAKHSRHLEFLRDFLVWNAVYTGRDYVEWIECYRHLWSALLYEDAAVQAEIKRLDNAIRAKGNSQEERQYFIMLRIHFDFIAGQDEQALARLQGEWTRSETSPFHVYLETLRFEKKWPRLLKWLTFLAPYARYAQQYNRERFFQYWIDGLLSQKNNEEWLRPLLGTLPASYEILTHYYAESGLWQEWSELQLVCHASVARIDKQIIKQLEKESPSLLLPIYHQEAEHLVLLKNRDAYKDSVKLLKKLQTLYRKSKRLDRWESFLQLFVKKHARLKAFQEELRKGKLIS
jgi:hypothetical protein